MGKRKAPDLKHLALEDDIGFGPVLEESVAIAMQPLPGRPTFADALLISQIVDDSPAQTREAFNPEENADDAELTASIAKDGVVLPILVVRIGNEQYRLAAGHRRVDACRRAGRADIRALIFPEGTNQQELDLFTFLENFHRKELSPLETARQIKYMRAECGWTQEEAAAALSISQTTVSQLLSLLKADEKLQGLVNDASVGLRNASSLMRLGSDEREKSYALIAKGVPVTDVIATAQKGQAVEPKGYKDGTGKMTSSKQKGAGHGQDPMAELLVCVLGTDDVRELKRALGRKSAYKQLAEQDRAVVALIGHYRKGDWQAGLEEYQGFTLPNRRALAAVVKQLARLHLLREGQRDREPGVLVFQLLAHTAQTLASEGQPS